MDEKQNPFESLSPEQRQRLANLSADISYDRITVSFSLEQRDETGRKMSCFLSLRAGRKPRNGQDADTSAADPKVPGNGAFSQDEARIVRLLVSKQVVAAVYDDAVKRRILSTGQAADELKPILTAYDGHLAKLVTGES